MQARAWTQETPKEPGTYRTRIPLGGRLVEEDIVVIALQHGRPAYSREICDFGGREWLGPLHASEALRATG